MSLAPGVRLGVYEVRDLIGAGGMGEVYRGHDTRLNRSVALKILPDHFAIDTERLARFTREAQVLASLNHSNIASIFGLEESNGIQALVLELIEGPTLADRIAQGPLPLEEALPLARQIADALEAAHSQGIVHRDLKPANIKIRPDGTVKVLDFGLAKAFDRTPEAETSALRTITSPAMTLRGVILGTAAYMSPEQARGKPVDKRCDIWAFGGVLYQMLTGKRAFDGEDVSDTLANVLKHEPNWSALPAHTPANVRRVLRRCLEKDPKRRVHDIADVRIDLDESEALVAIAAPAARPGVNLERVAWALLAASLAGGLAYTLTRPAPSPEIVRFQIEPPENAAFGSSTGIGRADGTSASVLSPDGTYLAFVAEEASRKLLWVRRFDSFVSRPLDGTDEALMPFWSPDSRSIGFYAGGKLKRVNLTDGAVQTICDASGVPRGAAWGSQEVIVFSVGTPPRMARVAVRGGAVTPLSNTELNFPRWPTFLPDGRHFLFLGRYQSAENFLIAASIEPGEELQRVVASDSAASFVAPGLLLYARDSMLLQHPFDPDRRQVSGDATPVLEHVYVSLGFGRADFSVSQTGVLAFRSSSNLPNQFAWLDRSGKVLETVGPRGNYRTPDLSPDGTRLAFTDVLQGDIWIYDLPRKTSSRFTTGSGTETAPVWFPDGKRIAYRSDQGGLFEKDAGGAGTERQLLKEQVNGPDQISPDGKWVLYFKVTTVGQTQDIYILPTTGDPKPVVLANGPFPEVEPQFSPNMRWLAYASSETGRNEVYVQPFPTADKRWQVSNSGGRQPLWRADGKELYFVADDRKFYAVEISDKAESFDYGTPHFLFDMPANVFNARTSYMPSRDGQRFLVNMVLGSDNAPISIVRNWQASLEK